MGGGGSLINWGMHAPIFTGTTLNISIYWNAVPDGDNKIFENHSNQNEGLSRLPNQIFNPWTGKWQPYSSHIQNLVLRQGYELRLRGIQQIQDRSNLFHFFSFENEGDAIDYMLTAQELYNKEIFAYLVEGSSGCGILILPWAGNDRTESKGMIGFDRKSKTITDFNKNTYKALLSLHTHPDDGPGDVPYRPSGDDIRNNAWRGVPGVIIAPNFYMLINNGLAPEAHILNYPTNSGLTEYLIQGHETLYRFIK